MFRLPHTLWIRVYFVFLVATCSTLVRASTLDCPRTLSLFVYHVQRGSIGRTDDALKEFREHTPAELHDRENPRGTFALEDDILSLFNVAPEFRDLAGFSAKWNLSEDQALDLLTYYGMRVFYDDAEISGNPRDIFKRLSMVSREHYLGEPETDTARRHLFYSANLTQLSVPELARLLGISEGKVYQDLSTLRFSIPEAFGDKLERAKILHASGTPVDEIAEQLDVGRQALEFVLHHSHDKSRGVAWDRTLFFEGKSQWETSLLVDLQNRGLTHQEIADKLNELAGVSNVTDPQLRTAQSISHKLSELGLAQQQRLAESSVYDSRYGYLKENGKLNSSIAISFVIDHYRMSDDWLANQLGVTQTAFEDFCRRHHLVRRADRLSFERSTSTQERLSQYERQRQAVSKIIEWMQNNPGKMPTESAFSGPGKVQLTGNQLFGTGHYRPGAKHHSLRFFDSREQALRAIKAQAQTLGLPFSYLDFHFKKGLSDSLRLEIQNEAVQRVVEWMKNHPGKMPTASTFGAGADKVGLTDHQLYGTAQYRAGAPYHSLRIFDSREDALRAIKAQAQARGLPFRYLDFQFNGGFPDSLRPEIQKEAAERVVQWMKDNPGKAPAQSDFGNQPNKVGIAGDQLFGTSEYRQNPFRIFDSREEALIAIKAEAQAQGVPFKYLDFQFRRGFPELIRPEVQKEAAQRVVEWLKKNPGKAPTQLDFGIQPSKIHLNAHQLYGTGSYKKGSKYHASRLFDSREEALRAIKAEAQTQQVPFRYLDISFIGGIPDSFRPEIQREAVQCVVEWMKSNSGRLPSQSDFGYSPGKLELLHNQFFGTAAYKDGGQRHSSRIFNSRDEALKAIQAEWERLGNTWPGP